MAQAALCQIVLTYPAKRGRLASVHHIQRKIINKLMYSPTLGYAKMRPAGVESNHFAYHLEQLLKAGYITKKDRDYYLTNKGKALADKVSHEKMDVRLQPHIVTSIFITNDSGKSLVFKHEFQPYFGLYGAPQGRLHYDETIADAAARELREKTGLEGVALTHRGMAYIQAMSGDETISKLLAHVFTGAVHGEPTVQTEAKSGTPSWINAASLNTRQCMPGFNDIRKLLENGPSNLFFAELSNSLS